MQICVSLPTSCGRQLLLSGVSSFYKEAGEFIFIKFLSEVKPGCCLIAALSLSANNVCIPWHHHSLISPAWCSHSSIHWLSIGSRRWMLCRRLLRPASSSLFVHMVRAVALAWSGYWSKSGASGSWDTTYILWKLKLITSKVKKETIVRLRRGWFKLGIIKSHNLVLGGIECTETILVWYSAIWWIGHWMLLMHWAMLSFVLCVTIFGGSLHKLVCILIWISQLVINMSLRVS